MHRTFPTLVLVSVLSGCNEPCEQRAADGSCYTGDVIDAQWRTDLLDDAEVRVCTLQEASSDLDLDNGCVDGVCLTDTFADIVDTWGMPQASDTGYYLYMRWEGRGISAFFYDTSDDALPNDDDYPRSIWLNDDWRGADARGLGLGVSTGCYIEAWGEPAGIDLADYDNDSRVPTRLDFERGDAPRIDVFDDHSQESWNKPDGYVDGLRMAW